LATLFYIIHLAFKENDFTPFNDLRVLLPIVYDYIIMLPLIAFLPPFPRTHPFTCVPPHLSVVSYIKLIPNVSPHSFFNRPFPHTSFTIVHSVFLIAFPLLRISRHPFFLTHQPFLSFSHFLLKQLSSF